MFCFNIHFAPRGRDGAKMYKMKIRLYWRKLQPTDWVQKLIRKPFTQLVKHVRSRAFFHKLTLNLTLTFLNQWGHPLLATR